MKKQPLMFVLFRVKRVDSLAYFRFYRNQFDYSPHLKGIVFVMDEGCLWPVRRAESLI